MSRFNVARGAIVAALGTALIAGPAAAQEPDTDRDNCICFDNEPGQVLGRTFMQTNRARIGVLLGETVEVDGRTGVEIQDVTRDGPAEGAGLENGDVITAIDGQELGAEPAEALVEAMGAVDPGETVTLTYYRDGARRTASVVTDEAEGWALFQGGDGFDVRVAPRLDADRLRDRMSGLSIVSPRGWVSRMTPAGLELVELNPGLGSYFGTENGVLVADLDDDSALGLEPGDVILAIDGRDVRDPAHVRAILSSYRDDEDITFQIVRRDRRTEVTGSMDR